MEWDTQVVNGSLLLDPAGLEAEEPGSCPMAVILQPEKCTVFQCTWCAMLCSLILHLSWDLLQSLGSVVFYRVTNDMVWEAPFLVGTEGWFKGSTYNLVFCITCGTPIGFHLYSTHAALAAVTVTKWCALKNKSHSKWIWGRYSQLSTRNCCRAEREDNVNACSFKFTDNSEGSNSRLAQARKLIQNQNLSMGSGLIAIFNSRHCLINFQERLASRMDGKWGLLLLPLRWFSKWFVKLFLEDEKLRSLCPGFITICLKNLF